MINRTSVLKPDYTTYIDRVQLKQTNYKIFQVIIPSIFYPYYLRYPWQPQLNIKIEQKYKVHLKKQNCEHSKRVTCQQENPFDNVTSTSKQMSLITVTVHCLLFWDNQTTAYTANGMRTVYILSLHAPSELVSFDQSSSKSDLAF